MTIWSKLAGVALERSLRFARRPGRLPVAVAIVGSVVVPLLRWLQPSAAGLGQARIAALSTLRGSLQDVCNFHPPLRLRAAT